MLDAIQISATGMRAHETEINTISHNVSNINTIGFRRQVVAYSELATDVSILEPKPENIDASYSHGAGAMAHVQLSTGMGELRKTGESLNVAIDGPGLLEVIRNDGSFAYTRAGSLAVNESGELTTSSGEVLSSRVNVPSGASGLQITSDGRVLTTVNGAVQELGRIELTSFSNPTALMATGDNLYLATSQAGEIQTAAPGEAGMGTLRQGYVETSNVQMIDEMVALMLAQRGFEMNSRVVQVADQVQSITNGLIK